MKTQKKTACHIRGNAVTIADLDRWAAPPLGVLERPQANGKSRTEDVKPNVTNAVWPDPERIGSDLPPVPEMDVEALLPAPLAGYVRDAAHRKVAPPEFVAVSLLVSLGALLGARCGVRPKIQDDWIVVPNLWGAIIAPPGRKKTP